MKTKFKQPTKTSRCPIRELHKLVDQIVQYAEEPSLWPLTQQEQIAFVRTVIFQARKIKNTEEYVTEAVMIAAENLAMAS